MKVSITEKSPLVREMEVTVDAESIEKAYDKAFKEALRHLSLPGFRRGKVPAYMGRKHIPNQMLNAQVADDVVPGAFIAAVRQEEIRPVSRPKFEVVALERGEDMVFKASFEIMPNIEFKDYKGMEITQERYEIQDKDVEDALEQTRAGRASLVAVTERGLQDKDVAFADFTGSVDGVKVESACAENFPMEIIPEHFVKGFLEALYGIKPGEERDFSVDFPEDYKSELASKHVDFHFALRELKERVLPELNDEFAKSVSEFNTLEELRTHIRKVMTDRVEDQANQGIASQIYVKLAEQVPQEMVPQGLVLTHAQMYHQNVAANLASRKQTVDAMLKAQGRTTDDWQKQVIAMGFGEARMEIMVRGIANQEGIEVSNEEMEEVVAEEAKRVGQSQAYIWKHMEESGNDAFLRYNMMRDKVTEFLAKSAKVTYVAPKTAEERAAEAAAKAAEAKAAEPEAEEPKAEETPAE